MRKGLTKRGKPRKTVRWDERKRAYIIAHHDLSDRVLAAHFGVSRGDMWQVRMNYGVGKKMCSITNHSY